MSSSKPVFVVLGAGAGIGGNVAKKFAREGYHVVLARRTDEEGLNKIIAEIEAEGGSATGHLLNAAAENTIENLVSKTESEIGPIQCALFNLGAQIGNRSLAKTPYGTFELGWRLATFGLFRLASALMPRMEARGSGSLLVTSATAAMRGNAGQHSHAAAMGGRRMLCQSLNAEFAPKGIHVAHILIDGPVESPDTLGRLILGEEGFKKLLEEKGQGKDELIIPEKLAETYYHIAHQHRSAWTHELDLRPFTDLAWWNH